MKINFCFFTYFSFLKRDIPSITVDEQDNRDLLNKEWSKYKSKTIKNDALLLNKMMNSQQKALDELKEISNDLYLEAVQVMLLTDEKSINSHKKKLF